MSCIIYSFVILEAILGDISLISLFLTTTSFSLSFSLIISSNFLSFSGTTSFSLGFISGEGVIFLLLFISVGVSVILFFSVISGWGFSFIEGLIVEWSFNLFVGILALFKSFLLSLWIIEFSVGNSFLILSLFNSLSLFSILVLVGFIWFSLILELSGDILINLSSLFLSWESEINVDEGFAIFWLSKFVLWIIFVSVLVSAFSVGDMSLFVILDILTSDFLFNVLFLLEISDFLSSKFWVGLTKLLHCFSSILVVGWE